MTMNWRQVPEPDHEPLKTLIAEMASIGWPTVQWGNSGVVISPKGNYRTAFFEAFGSADGFIRGEGATVLESAKKALAKIKKQAACSHPDDSWKYTHNNGYKTCGLCGYFTACTVEEAMSHYDHGEIRVPEKGTYLMFDFRRPLCPTCGGHILAHDYAFDINRCECGQRLEVVNDNIGRPEYDVNHNLVLRPIDTEPKVVGFWHPAQGLWLGEEGHMKTWRVSEIQRWRRLIDDDLQGGKFELRLVNSDLTPGEVVPFSFDREADGKAFAVSLKAVVEHLAGMPEADEPTSSPSKEG